MEIDEDFFFALANELGQDVFCSLSLLVWTTSYIHTRAIVKNWLYCCWNVCWACDMFWMKYEKNEKRTLQCATCFRMRGGGHIPHRFRAKKTKNGAAWEKGRFLEQSASGFASLQMWVPFFFRAHGSSGLRCGLSESPCHHCHFTLYRYRRVICSEILLIPKID